MFSRNGKNDSYGILWRYFADWVSATICWLGRQENNYLKQVNYTWAYRTTSEAMTCFTVAENMDLWFVKNVIMNKHIYSKPSVEETAGVFMSVHAKQPGRRHIVPHF